MALGQNFARILTDLPANICTPDYLLRQAHELKKDVKEGASYEVNHLSEEELTKMGAGCITAVGMSSSMPTYIIEMVYKGPGAGNSTPICLVGKGVVHDSGGLSIKPTPSMLTMKGDMGGAAACFGTLKSCMLLNLPVNLTCYIPTVENAIGSKSFRPGDVLKSLNGMTVEIGNTDAEGRLILCDALTYAGMRNLDRVPKGRKLTVVDLATLTGAIITALGPDLTGGYANDPNLLGEFVTAGLETGDRVWPMPLTEVDEQYSDMLKSNCADINNLGGAPGGSITAALFLSKFTKRYQWGHLDIAAVANESNGNGRTSNNFTGRPVSMLTQFLMNRCGKGER